MKNITFIISWIFYLVILSISISLCLVFFLYGLEFVTNLRVENGWIIYLLPFVGAFFMFFYHRHRHPGLEQINFINPVTVTLPQSTSIILLPIHLFGTLLGHLVGASIGRTGTGVQIGAVIANVFGHQLKLTERQKHFLVANGMCAAFGTIFGAPFAAALFGFSYRKPVKHRIRLLFSGFFCAVIAKWVVVHTHIHYVDYPQLTAPNWSMNFFWVIFILAILCGFLAYFFEKALAVSKWFFDTFITSPILRIVLGATCLLILTASIQSTQFLGLGIPLIQSAINGEVHLFDFLFKLLFTAISLGAGFIGGTVSPIFVIGSLFGSSFAAITHLSPVTFTPLGLIGVFSGLVKNPFVSFVLGIELFGYHATSLLFIVCLTSFLTKQLLDKLSPKKQAPLQLE